MQINLFHAYLHFIMEPTIKAGLNGVLMKSGDGVTRNYHLLFAIHVDDYPEQCICVKAKKCSICTARLNQLGVWNEAWIT